MKKCLAAVSSLAAISSVAMYSLVNTIHSTILLPISKSEGIKSKYFSIPENFSYLGYRAINNNIWAMYANSKKSDFSLYWNGVETNINLSSLKDYNPLSRTYLSSRNIGLVQSSNSKLYLVLNGKDGIYIYAIVGGNPKGLSAVQLGDVVLNSDLSVDNQSWYEYSIFDDNQDNGYLMYYRGTEPVFKLYKFIGPTLGEEKVNLTEMSLGAGFIPKGNYITSTNEIGFIPDNKNILFSSFEKPSVSQPKGKFYTYSLKLTDTAYNVVSSVDSIVNIQVT